MTQHVVTFSDIKESVASFRFPLPEAGMAAKAARSRESQLVKPRGSLGRLESLAEWVSTWQARHPPTMQNVCILVFAGNHGVVERGISAYPSEVTAKMVEMFQRGGAAINQLARNADADLRVYDLTLDAPTADFTQGPAMSQEACCAALAMGMNAVDDGLDLLCLGEMGIGNTTAAAALCNGLFGGPASHWVGLGTGVDAAGLARKEQAVTAAIKVNTTTLEDPLRVLQYLGGYEIAALVGAVLTARQKSIPVLLDGFVCTAAASVLFKLDAHALDHCVVAHRSAESAHGRLLTILGKEPLLDFAMRLGEASAAALAVPLIRGAVACHSGMVTFAEANILPGSEHASDQG